MAISSELRNKLKFDWEVLDVVIGGKSAIDTTHPLSFQSNEDANRFLDCYGYNIENPIEKAELFGNFHESIGFIKKYFLHPENPNGIRSEFPRKILEITDFSQLLHLSGPGGSKNLSLWACAIMKVMHTISHMDKDLRTNYIVDIQTQILDRFYKFIHSDENNQLYLGLNPKDIDRIDLVSFESKPKKSRDSVILKLLHKPENVAEELFDRVGIRFVTKTTYDSIKIVKFLRDRFVIMPANIKPSRSRNTLFDVAKFQTDLKNIIKEVEGGKITLEEAEKTLETLSNTDSSSKALSKSDKENPHTSEEYRSIQFTCRQLIKIRNPVYNDIKTLKQSVKETTVPDSIAKVVDRIELKNVQKEIRFFYPYEVQIYDEKSHQENLEGRSSHGSYKNNQIQAALKRVMGPLARSTEHN